MYDSVAERMFNVWETLGLLRSTKKGEETKNDHKIKIIHICVTIKITHTYICV